MKRLLAILTLCLLLLTGCGDAPAQEASGKKDTGKTVQPVPNGDPSGDENPNTPPEPVGEDLVEGNVTFTPYVGAQTEYAVIACRDDSGALLWEHWTEENPIAQSTTLAEVGRYKNQYIFVANGVLYALDMQTGAVTWINSDFAGWPAEGCSHIGQDGSIYLAGYYGPDFFMADRYGNTVLSVATVDSDYLWPCRIEVGEDSVAIYMRGTTQGDLGVENAVPVYVELP